MACRSFEIIGGSWVRCFSRFWLSAVGTTDPQSPYARAREGVTRKQQESEPEPSVTEALLLTVATDCGDESRGVREDCAAHAVAKDSRSRALISSNLGRPRRRCATRALNLSGGWLCSPPGRRPRWQFCPGPGPVRSARDVFLVTPSRARVGVFGAVA